jgi:multidrug efflux pump subunit AcrA (membrane-fusion protein)
MSLLRGVRERQAELQAKEKGKPDEQQEAEQARLQAQQQEAQIQQNKAKAAEHYHMLVTSTLEQLRKSVYPQSSLKTDYGEPIEFVVRAFPENYKWSIGYEKASAMGGYFVTLISVFLEFDHKGQATAFLCERFQESYQEFEGKIPKKLREALETSLSREELVEALRELHLPVKKAWWQFWE